jgi:hypothetical protein
VARGVGSRYLNICDHGDAQASGDSKLARGVFYASVLWVEISAIISLQAGRQNVDNASSSGW